MKHLTEIDKKHHVIWESVYMFNFLISDLVAASKNSNQFDTIVDLEFNDYRV